MYVLKSFIKIYYLVWSLGQTPKILLQGLRFLWTTLFLAQNIKQR